MIDVINIVLNKIEEGITSFDEKIGEYHQLVGDTELQFEYEGIGGNPHEIKCKVVKLDTDNLIIWNEITEESEEFKLDEDFLIRELEK